MELSFQAPLGFCRGSPPPELVVESRQGEWRGSLRFTSAGSLATNACGHQ